MLVWDQMSGKQKAGVGGGVLVLFLGLAYWGNQLPAQGAEATVSVLEPPEAGREAGRAVEEGPIRVYVSGAVRRPGVYEVRGDALVQDALYLAGGATAEADLDGVNLASRMIDGQQVHVPYFQFDEAGARVKVNIPSVVSINLGTKEELMSLPGIGETTAEKIIEHRTANGPFERVEDLVRVAGIGEKTMERLHGLVRL